ncbi:hypothetical protein CRM22_004573 [Opisthorchis felineus]|uniref:Glycine amidinotransferase n=1 Tax=Opisthorchis felineus TaxID=147828 RepID=A0A4S2M0U7_OPIFE|nr:hypothetical protein CRM22_004573 [Opisthorchis felineus]
MTNFSQNSKSSMLVRNLLAKLSSSRNHLLSSSQIFHRKASDAAGNSKAPTNSSSPVWSWNEWDPLEEIIVGTPEGAVVPRPLPEVKMCTPMDKWEFYEKNAGRYWADCIPKEHWEKAVEEVEEYVRVLQMEGVKVLRPSKVDHSSTFKLLGFESQGFYAAMPRDFLLVIGDELIEATMTWRSRYFEYLAYRPILLEYWKQGAKWTVAPKPTDFDAIMNKEVIKKLDSGVSDKSNIGFITTESEPCFDAADFTRAGRDIFCQRSQVTNLAGIEWVRRHVEPLGIRVHQLTFTDPRPMHIDATFVFAKPGIAIQNPDRPCDQVKLIKAAGWDVIDAPTPNVPKSHPYWLGSPWLSMNVLMLDPERVLVEKGETAIHEMYRRIGITPIPVALRHANSIGGSFHCWTSDIKRRGNLESYFDWSKAGCP